MRLKKELHRLAAAHRAGRALALLFDFDGTLAPLVTHPDLAVSPAATREALSRLTEIPRVLVGIISGRALANLRAKIHLPRLVYSGTSGLELDLHGKLLHPPEAERFLPDLHSAAESIGVAIRSLEGAWIEHKPLAFTVHFRQVKRDEVPVLRQLLAEVLHRHRTTLIGVDGSLATEVLPNIGWSKGEALSAIMAWDGRDAIPLYTGNDANDAGAMRAAVAAGGVAIGIGPHAPADAQHELFDVDELTELLEGFCTLLTTSETADVREPLST